MDSDSELTSSSSCSDLSTLHQRNRQGDLIKRHKCTYPDCTAAFNRPWKLERHKNSHTKDVCRNKVIIVHIFNFKFFFSALSNVDFSTATKITEARPIYKGTYRYRIASTKRFPSGFLAPCRIAIKLS